MKMTVKRWYRSRRNQFLIFTAVMLFVFYYIAVYDNVHREPDLDVTRSISNVEAPRLVHRMTTNSRESVLSGSGRIVEPNFKDSSTTANLIAYRSVYVVPRCCDPKIKTYVKFRSSVIEYIENRLQEALKEDKGTGCEVPKLDPFAYEVTQFDKELPKVVCEGRDWVKCYLSKCTVVKEILENTKDIECTYKDILYHSDSKYTIGPSSVVAGDGVYTLTNSDHVKVKCTGKHIDNNQSLADDILPSKWTGHCVGYRDSVKPVAPPPGREDSPNVLILGFDSTSRNGFIRRMPKSYKVLTEELGAIVLEGYNIVGDGTPAALFPILTGKTELELPESRKSIHGSGHLDDMPFIFYKLKEDGYRTAYYEDMPWVGTFQYRFNGFQRQPADHYLRAFYLEESGGGGKWWRGGATRYCVGAVPQYQLMLDITDQFFKLEGKRFGFTFIADITHDDFNMIATSDEDVADFLRRFQQQGHLTNTMLIVMGDHGPRYAKVRDTFQGKLEERLPLMSIILPEDFKRDRPTAQAALEDNVEALTTPHDIHATILDALGLTQYWNDYRIMGADLKRGLSLLEPVPRNRSCSEAGIEPHWCACLKWANVSSSDPLYERASRALVSHLDSITHSMRSKCAPRTLTSIEWVMRQRADSRVLSFEGARDADGYVGKFGHRDVRQDQENYQLKIVVGPGHGVYEASMTYLKREDRFLIDTREISRTNAYGSEPSCISDTKPHLNMFCYCND